MCLIIAIIALVYAVVSFYAHNYINASLSLAVSLFFAALMAYNIKKTYDSRH